MRAVFYCRVSTDEDSQLNALEYQIQEAKNCISSMCWELVDGYIDEAKSGTSTKKRNEYKRLFEDLALDKFDVLVIKSQDRLMRNTKEWYVFVDALTVNQKKLYFYLENKFYTPDDALLTGIKAILAEEYSRELSKKVRNSHKNRQDKGTSVLLTSATWGYDKVNKEVVINEKEADIVRLIYELCIQGYGSRLISRALSERGIFGRSGGHFPEVTIRRIIRNPLFKGTVVMNKRSTDLYTKETVQNQEHEWKFHENAVPAIVTNEVWDEANKIMDSRSREIKTDAFTKKMVGKNKGKYDLSVKIFCGICGSVYWRRYRRGYKNKDEIIVDWSCSEYIKRGNKGCGNIHINESALMNILAKLASEAVEDKKSIATDYAIKIINAVLAGNDDVLSIKKKNSIEMKKVLAQKNILLDKLLDGLINDSDYKMKDDELTKKLRIVSDIEKNIIKRETDAVDTCERIDNIKAFLSSVSMKDANALKMVRHINKIVVFMDKLEIDLDFCEKITVGVLKRGRRSYLYADTDI